MKFLFSVIILLTSIKLVVADNLREASSIAARGMEIQSKRMTVISENLANELSTSDQPGGEPYRRKKIFVENKLDRNKKHNILKVKKIEIDKKTPLIMKYEPEHPAADEQGYVRYPNVTREIERADYSEAQRSYEVNLAVVELSKKMMQKTIEAMK